MNKVNNIILSHESKLTDFIEWQIEHEPTSNYNRFSEPLCNHKDLPKYASILYKEYIEIEGVILWKDHYTEDYWKDWRKNRTAYNAANVINHIHIESLTLSGDNDDQNHDDITGQLISFFWNMALQAQFPNRDASVKFDGDIIYIEQKDNS